MNNSISKRMLVILAHPDEQFAALSGLLGRYAGSGVQVVLLCATCGEAGCSEEAQHADFQRTAREMGIEVYSLGYSNVDLATVDSCMLLESITCWLDLVKPQLILTAGPVDALRNPDEAVLSKIATRAYDECCQKGLLVYSRPSEDGDPTVLLTSGRGTRDTENYPDWFEDELVERQMIDEKA